MEEKFKKIDDLTKKFLVMKRLISHPEVTVLLMLDLIEGNFKLKKEKEAQKDEAVIVCAEPKELEVSAQSGQREEKSEQVFELLNDLKFMMIEGVIKKSDLLTPHESANS